MPKISMTSRRPLYLPGKYTPRIVGWSGRDLCVDVCQFQFVLSDIVAVEVYIEWFASYGKRHRRQSQIIEAYPHLRNDLCKLPAHLFKRRNREKVLKGLRQALQIGRISWRDGQSRAFPNRSHL